MFRDLADGQHRGIRGRDYSTTAYFHLPKELESEMTDSGFSVVELFSVEGVSEIIPNLQERMQDDSFRSTLFDTIRLTEQDGAIMGMSAHVMGIGKKA